MYHGISAGSFTRDQLGLLRTAEPMVRALVGQFGLEGLKQPAVDFDAVDINQLAQASINQQIEAAFINFGSASLTEREREAAHLILRGHSVKSAARVVDISAETVRMHRKNLYAKLNVNSQSELFALFIEGLTLSAANSLQV
jgi:DNA-binding CsgD family transcriptional regulator